MFDSINEIDAERPIMQGKGRIVKASFTDEPPPNTSWYWFPLGNCGACRYNVRDTSEPYCADDRVSDDEYMRYYQTNTCPFFAPGDIDMTDQRTDVMREAGIVRGAPTRPVKILQNVPWTPQNTMNAHEQRAHFLRLARFADSGNANEPTNQEFVDMAGDPGLIDISDGNE